MSSVDGLVVETFAVRIESPSNASSPKNAPTPRRTGVGSTSTSTSPAAMKYMQSPTLPRRMTAIRSGTSTRRSMWVISVIEVGSSVWKNGTLLTKSQVSMKLRRRLSAAKPVARMPVHNPKVAMPQIITTDAEQMARSRYAEPRRRNRSWSA